MNLNHVTLPALNMAESVVFYQRLGLIIIVDTPHYARFKSPEGDATLSVDLVETLPAKSSAVVYFEVADLDRKVQQLQTDGLDFFQLPRDEPWLWREARLKDPAGNEICLYRAGANRLSPPWRVDTAHTNLPLKK